MGGFTGGGNGGAGGPGPGPEVPVPDFKEQAKQTAQGFKEAGSSGDFWARAWGHAVDGAHFVLKMLISLADAVISDVVLFFGAFGKGGTTGFASLVGALLEDLLGVDVDANAIARSFEQGGERGSMATVGGLVFDKIAKDLGAGGALSPESGEAAAKAWLGFLVEFSVRHGNISFIQSILPFEELSGIREYGEMLQKSMGLGRLARQAFTPLMKVLIADPLTWKLNRQYHPTRLSAAESVRAHNRNLIDDQTFQEEMDFSGYNDARKAALLEDNLVQLSAADVFELWRWGEIDQETAVIWLRRAGWHPEVAARFLLASGDKEASTSLALFLTELASQRVNQFIDAPTFRGIVDTLPLSQKHKDFFAQAVGQRVEFPRRRLTLAETQAAFVDGILDLTDVTDFLKEEGYDDVSANTLQLQTLLKLTKNQETDAVKQYRYNLAVAKAKKKGEPIPPVPAGLKPAPGA